jgi:hypothetical protein
MCSWVGLGILSNLGAQGNKQYKKNKHLSHYMVFIMRIKAKVYQSTHYWTGESQATGMEILEELRSQRETMERARDRTDDMNASLSSAEKLLGKMSQWWRRF